MVPASLSRLQRDVDAFNRLFAQTLTVTAFAGCGALVLVAVEAPALVGVLLGKQWEAAIPLVRWLTLSGSDVDRRQACRMAVGATGPRR